MVFRGNKKQKQEESSDVVEAQVPEKPLPPPPTPQQPKAVFEDRYEYGEVATSTERVVINKENNEALGVVEALVLVLNKLDKIEEYLEG